MKKSIKKAALTTLSIVEILSMMPSALCAPGGENETPKNLNQIGHIDSFNIMVVGKYFNSVEDFKNLAMVNKKYRGVVERYLYNPVKITSEEFDIFSRIGTYFVGENEGDFVPTFPHDKIKRLIYLPGSFNLSQFLSVLRDNKIICGNLGNISEDWERKIEFDEENPLYGGHISFVNNKEEKEIVFRFRPCDNGTLNNIEGYNLYLASCGISDERAKGKAVIPTEGELFLPNNVSSIGPYAFERCTELTNVNIPNSVTSIGEGAFLDCKGLEGISIPNSVTSIDKDAFSYCENLVQANIPSHVKSISEEAFGYCANLADINIPKDVESIGEAAFVCCMKIKNITIPNTVKSIGPRAFEWCFGLEKVNIPKSVTRLENSVFNRCESLTEIDIPDSVTYIGKKAFFDCYRLRSVKIPNSVKFIGDCAFSVCSSLTDVVISNSVETIGNEVFAICRSLTHVEIPDSVKRIGNGAFRSCVSLSNITIPTSVTDLAEDAFEDCPNLNRIEFNGQVYDSVDSFMNAFEDYIKIHNTGNDRGLIRTSWYKTC